MRIIINESLGDIIENFHKKNELEDLIIQAIDYYLYEFFQVDDTHNCALMLDNLTPDIKLKIDLYEHVHETIN